MGGRLSPAADEHILRDGPVEELFTFYYCHRATLRARLAIAHLLEDIRAHRRSGRGCAPLYLDLAKKSARRLVRTLKHHEIGQAALVVQRRIASLSRGAAGKTMSFLFCSAWSSRKGGTASVMTIWSMALSARTSLEPGMNSP